MPNSADEITYFLDTNAIAEAHRVGIWSALSNAHKIATVMQCIEESCRPDKWGKILVNREPQDLINDFDTVYPNPTGSLPIPVIRKQIALDKGEKFLVIQAFASNFIWMICGPDKATVRALHACNKADRMISLEELIEKSGQKPRVRLEPGFTKSWLSKYRTELMLDNP